MKTAIFCSKPISPFIILALLPENVTEIISTENFGFSTHAVAQRLNCSYSLAESVDEAISQAEWVFAIWDGLTQGIVDAVKTAKRSGKRVMFSLIP